jgi:hypothetical protein
MEASTAVTITNQPQIVIGVGSGGQSPAPVPFLESVRLNLFPGHQRARLVLQFDDVAGLETKLFSKLARNCDLAVLQSELRSREQGKAGES